jgi:hypothetical protein
MALPSHYAAERAAHDSLADRSGSLAAGRFAEFGRNLCRNAESHGPRDVAGYFLGCGQHGAARPTDAKNATYAIADPMEEAGLGWCSWWRLARGGQCQPYPSRACRAQLPPAEDRRRSERVFAKSQRLKSDRQSDRICP